jgi:hypothetical protein
MKNKELKRELEKYLNSKSNAGGLYGLTIRDKKFIPSLIRIFNKFINAPDSQDKSRKHLTLEEVNDQIIKDMENAD